MVAKKSQNSPLCHRCNLPMTFRKSEVATGKEMQVYECDICKTLEAFDPRNPCPSVPQPGL